MEEALMRLSDILWAGPLAVVLLGTGILFTVRLRGIQLRKLGAALRSAFSSRDGGGITPYAALCTALAAMIGTGNIVGVATALCTGGPGALLWMLIAAFLGMATQYAEGYLAVRYRRKTKNGWFGGPFCYMETDDSVILKW